MTIVAVKINHTDAIRQLMERIGSKGVSRALAATAEDVEDYAAKAAALHNKSGALVRSLETRKISPQDFVVRHRAQHAPHAIFVHDGTRPHTISPKPGGKNKMLRWPAAGGFVFAKQVNHPGYKGDKWMDRAAELAPKWFEQHLREVLK
jgi:hypothetical protein